MTHVFKILLWGNGNELFDQAFLQSFEQFLFICPEHIYADSHGYYKNIIVSNSCSTNIVFDFIVLKSRNFLDIPTSYYDANTLFVFEDGNVHAVDFLKEAHNRCICYGPSERDSITFSAVNDDYITVSIQRSIQYRKKSLDIQEFNIRKRPEADAFACISGNIIKKLIS